MRSLPTVLLLFATLLAWPASGLPLPAPPALPIEDFATGRDTTCVVQLRMVRCVDAAGDVTFADLTGTATGVASSIDNVCVLRVVGTVDCHGFFGDGDGYLGTDPAVHVEVGAFHGCVLTRGGNVHCWGNNAQGEAIHHTGGDAADVAVGGWHTCILFTSGSVRCEGDTEEQMFNHTGTDAVQVSAGASHTCILFEDRTVRCRGWGYDGETVVDGSGLAVEVAAGEWGVTCVRSVLGTVACDGYAWSGGGAYATPDALAVKSGWGHSCALTAGGTRLACWGSGAPASYPF